MLYLAAACFAVMGITALAAPIRFAEPLGLNPTPRRGTNEVRAVYGGFGLAIAALLIAVADDPALRPGACTAVALALYGMAAGRLVSAAVERGIHPLMAFFVLFEVGLGTLVWWQRHMPPMS